MTDNLYFPAEWEYQSMIQLTWPHSATDWCCCLEAIIDTFVAFAEVITRYERLLVVTPDVEATRTQMSGRLTPEAMSLVSFCPCPTNDTWARDHGALTLLDNSGDPSKALLLDFQFNGWGKKFPAALDNAINRHIAAAGLFTMPLESHDDFVLEGGSVESDGQGTVFTTTQCLLAPNRNQPLTRQEIEQQLKTLLHAHRVVWLHHGQLEGDDTDGHIDTIVRCAPGDTLLYVFCNDTGDSQYEELHALESELLSLRTSDGHPFRLLPLPLPSPIYEDGERLPATYANFLILNGAVIVPTYGQPERDAQAMSAIGKAFPDRDIIGLDARQVIRQHGSLHCLTMQYY